MATVNIDNKEYDLDTLSDECKAQLTSIQFVQQELARFQAKAAYLQALKVSLAAIGESDTINKLP